jgi:hypothetical protein
VDVLACGANRCRIGSANAAVLPVPVCARGQYQRNSLLLDRGRLLVAEVLDRREERRDQAELFETRTDDRVLESPAISPGL